jgi:hypothetical protein
MVLGTVVVVVRRTPFLVSTVVSGDDGLSLSESEPQAARPRTPSAVVAASAPSMRESRRRWVVDTLAP